MKNKELLKMNYSDYWSSENWEKRETRKYYKKLYDSIKRRLIVPLGSKILDIGGGDGHLMHYLGLKEVDIIDISDSGLEIAQNLGFKIIKADIQKSFPIKSATYDVAFCFEVLEHLYFPEITISEIYKALKSNGFLYLGQPNMKADGVHHIRRFYKKDIEELLLKNGFKIEWMDYVPGFIMRDAIVDDIKKTPSILRKIKQVLALAISLLPRNVLYKLAQAIPDRFCLIFVIKACKNTI